jgi:hypothetical protein
MKRSRQVGEPRRQIFTQVDAQDAAATLREDLKISPGLRRFDHAEGVRLSGYRQVHGIVARDLEKYSAIRSTFVSLSCEASCCHKRRTCRRRGNLPGWSLPRLPGPR